MSAPVIARLFFVLLISLVLAAPAPAQKRAPAKVRRKTRITKILPIEIPRPPDPEQDILPRAILALQLAEVVYLLPDFDSKDTALKSRKYFAEFKQKMPSAVNLALSESDPKTGLRVAAFTPKPSGNKPSKDNLTAAYIAIAGTEGFRDRIADFSFGRSQSQHLLEFIDQIISQYKPSERPEIIISGHSLGGGLAQAVAWYLEKNLATRKVKPSIWLFTFNAFGAQEMLRKQDKDFDPLQSHLTYAANYFVRGEPVSKLGTHIGPTYELVPTETNEKKSKIPFLNMDGFNRHRIETVVELVNDDPTILIKAQEVKTERKFYISLLTGVMDKTSGVTKYLPKLSFSLSSKSLPDVLTDLYHQITSIENPTKEDREFFDWLETTTQRIFPKVEEKTKSAFEVMAYAKNQALLRFYELNVPQTAKQKAADVKRRLKKEFE